MRCLLSVLSPAGPRARLMIFPYHRVLESPDPLLPTLPTAEQFERQLQWIRLYCNPLPLTEAVELLDSGGLPSRAVAVTFDDGYADNLHIAAPLLKRYRIPAVVFVAVDALERGIMWNDIILESVRAASEYIDAEVFGLGRLDLTGTARRVALGKLIARAQYRPTQERMELAEALYARVSCKPLQRKMLRPKQLLDLMQEGVEIGAHTITHPILSTLSDSEARAEIEGSRRWIGEVTGVEPRLFAYPNGRRGQDYGSRDADIVRALGFRAAVSTNRGCATHRSSLYELPRFKPWEDTSFGFVSRLCKAAVRSYL